MGPMRAIKGMVKPTRKPKRMARIVSAHGTVTAVYEVRKTAIGMKTSHERRYPISKPTVINRMRFSEGRQKPMREIRTRGRLKRNEQDMITKKRKGRERTRNGEEERLNAEELNKGELRHAERAEHAALVHFRVHIYNKRYNIVV